ncbi:MAG TPA: cellulose binding domain-containing protein [Cellvibrio sp.]|nr:cellulose binding domain-containing protein [Cellvibrio sp.]
MKTSIVKTKSVLRNTIAALTLGIIAAPAFSLSPPALTGWTVQNGKLMDPNGNPFIFRGVTIDHGRAPDKTIQALKDISALGANSAQIEFPITYQVPFVFPRTAVTELVEIIKTCAETKLVCVLEPNDVAGFGTTQGVASPSNTADLWQKSDMQMALSAPGVTNHIIIGLGNQHFGSGEGLAEFYRGTLQNYTHFLVSSLPPNFLVMIDGSDWSQDSDKSMHQVALGINQDSTLKHRVIYSVDFFSDYVDPEKVRDYITSFAEIGAPLVVGGFGPVPYYHPFRGAPLQLDAPQLPAASVMKYAEQYGAGYFGWSWSGNENSALDVVSNWDSNNLSVWGNLLFNDANGIKATAKRASIFNNASSSVSSSVSSSSVPANRPPVAAITYNFEYVRCGQTYGYVTASGSSDPDGDPLTYQWEITGYGGTKTSSEPAYRFYMQPPHYYTIKLTVSDGKGGVTTTSIVRNHTNSDNCTGSSSISSSIARTSSSRPFTSSSLSSSTSSLYCPLGNSFPDCPFRTWNYEYCYARRGPAECAGLPHLSSSSSSSSRSSSSRSASSVPVDKAQCSYVINSQWGNGFTATIRIKNTSNTAINGWDVNWQYTDGSKVTHSWNATLSGTNPYAAKNLNWNATIQPGQTIEFGFQGSKSAGAAAVPVVSGAICQ